MMLRLHRFAQDGSELDPRFRAIAPGIQVRLGDVAGSELRPDDCDRRDVSAFFYVRFLPRAGGNEGMAVDVV